MKENFQSARSTPDEALSDVTKVQKSLDVEKNQPMTLSEVAEVYVNRENKSVVTGLNENNHIIFEDTSGSLNHVDEIQAQAHEITDSSRHNFSEVNQLLQIDKSLLLELHPEIDSIVLSDINPTQLPEIPQSTRDYNQSNSEPMYKSVPQSNGDIVLGTTNSTDPKNPLFDLEIQTNSPQSQLAEIPTSVQSISSSNEKTFIQSFVWDSQNVSYPIELNTLETMTNLNGGGNNCDEIRYANDGLKSACIQPRSNLIDLDSPVVLSESISSPSFNEEMTVGSPETPLSQNTDVNISSNTLPTLDEAELDQLKLLVLRHNGEISTAPVTPTKPDKGRTKPRSACFIEPMKGRYFKSKFKLNLESKEYLICSFCHEKIGVDLEEVTLHCKTCTSIVRRDRSGKFRFGCFTCDYKSNQKSHLTRHLTAHLRYVPK